jgi:hypothetical protein
VSAATGSPAPGGPEPGGLTLLGHIDFSRMPCTDIAVSDGFAYVGTYYAAEDGRVFIADVRDPANPQHVQTYMTTRGEAVLDLAARDGIAVIALSGGIDILDVSNPAEPRLIRNYTTDIRDGVHTVYLDGRYAFLVDDGGGGGMHIVDYSNPAEPVEVAFHAPSGRSHDMTVVGDLCYLANLDGGFEILDVSNRARPRVVARRHYSDAFTHNIWPTADGRFAVTTDETCGTGHLRVWNITDYADIRQVGSFAAADQGDTCVHNAQVVGDYVFMSYYQKGLQVASIANPADVRYVGSHDTWNGEDTLGFGCFAGAWGVAAERAPDGSTLVYVSDIATGLWVYRFGGGEGTDPAPIVRLKAPTEGRLLAAGERIALAWEAADSGGLASQRIELSTDDGATFTPIADVNPLVSSYVWEVPAVDTARARLRLTVSDGVNPPVVSLGPRFTISSTPDRTPFLSVAFPAGGEVLAAGRQVPVAWVLSDESDLEARVELSTDGGATFAPLDVTSAAAGRGTWTVPSTPTERARIRVVVSDGTHGEVADVTPVDFTISAAAPDDVAAPLARVFEPSGNDLVGAGSVLSVSFESIDDIRADRAVFEVSYDGGATYRTIGATAAAGLNKHEAYSLPVPDTLARGRVRLRMVAIDAAGNAAVAEADGQLNVLPLPRLIDVRGGVRRRLELVADGVGFTVGESVVYAGPFLLASPKFPRRVRDGEGGASSMVVRGASLDAAVPVNATVGVSVVNPATGQRSNELLYTRQ